MPRSGPYSSERFTVVSRGTSPHPPQWPECWNACDDAECVNPDRPTFKGCPQFVEAAVASFVQLGGRRIDSADTYHSQAPAAFAMLRAGVPRNATFFVAKLGPSLPMGATDSHAQFNRTLLAANLTYVDHLQLHWPSCAMGNGCGPATDPACSNSSGAFDEVKCRMNTCVERRSCPHGSSRVR